MASRCGSTVTADIKRPSRLNGVERAAWREFMAQAPHLQRAFFTHAFALACERAHGHVRVAVLRQGHALVGFLPFQFAGAWQRRAGLAEQIGGALCDHAGLIARPGFRIDPLSLPRLCRVGVLSISDLSDGQAEFGLCVPEIRSGHVIDLTEGPAAYLLWLNATNRDFVAKTKRRLRRLTEEYGAVTFTYDTCPSWPAVRDLLDSKRAQYARTGVGDPFTDPARLGLIRALVEAADPECCPVLTTLAAGERLLARHFGLVHQGHLSYWFPVYDPEASKLSPGRMLLWFTITDADRHGLRLIDRGEGDSQAKRDFSTGVRRFGRAAWHDGGWRSLAARACQSVAWRLRL